MSSKSKTQKKKSMSESDFPPEILFDILSRLPPKDLIRFLCVSKSWYAIIHDHHFIKAHLQRSIQTNSARTLLLRSNCPLWPNFYLLPFNGDEAFGTLVPIEQPLKCPGDYPEMLGCSVNGVVCIHDGECTDVCLWNTSIQKFKKIPLPTLEHQPPSYFNRYTLFGFGYDSANHDFKVLRITQFENRKRESVGSQVGVYSLKSNSWKKIQSLPCNGFSVHRREIVFTNGSLCWLMRKDNNGCIILTLDFASENYREFHTPVDEDDNCTMNLVVLRGSLCIFVNNRSSRHEVWIMKSDSWTLLYSIVPETAPWWFGYCGPLGFSKNGEMVLLQKGEGTFVWFDLEQKNSNEVDNGGLPLVFKATICLGSLFLLDGDSVASEEEISEQPPRLHEAFETAVKNEQPLKCPDDSTTILGCSMNGVVCISLKSNLWKRIQSLPCSGCCLQCYCTLITSAKHQKIEVKYI